MYKYIKEQAESNIFRLILNCGLKMLLYMYVVNVLHSTIISHVFNVGSRWRLYDFYCLNWCYRFLSSTLRELWFVRLENFGLNFSSLSFATPSNFFHCKPSSFLFGISFPQNFWSFSTSANNYFELLFPSI